MSLSTPTCSFSTCSTDLLHSRCLHSPSTPHRIPSIPWGCPHATSSMKPTLPPHRVYVLPLLAYQAHFVAHRSHSICIVMVLDTYLLCHTAGFLRLMTGFPGWHLQVGCEMSVLLWDLRSRGGSPVDENHSWWRCQLLGPHRALGHGLGFCTGVSVANGLKWTEKATQSLEETHATWKSGCPWSCEPSTHDGWALASRFFRGQPAILGLP